ncbi:MAG: hypothetical protein ACLTC3_10875 [Evtepia gabavorous]
MKRIHNRLAILLIFALLLSLAAPVGRPAAGLPSVPQRIWWNSPAVVL